MNQEIMSAAKAKKSILDPRTKILLLLLVAVFVLGSTGGEKMIGFRYFFTLLPFFCLIVEGKGKTAVKIFVVFVFGILLQIFLNGKVTGFLGFLVLGSCGILTQFLPGMMMGYYVLSTTTVSEFIAAMQKAHVTDKLTIPLSVMFRFFPTVGEECMSINNAMKMRGIGLAGGDIAKMVEYRIVPMMTCSVRIGEELSAAALTRGLGGTEKRTNICTIGFGVLDVIVWICAFLAMIWLLIGLFL